MVRGHNRDPIIARKADARYFVASLTNAAENYRLAVHTWVLMTNHLHLLATPGTPGTPGTGGSLPGDAVAG